MNILKQLDWKLNSAVLFLTAFGLLSFLSVKPALFYRQSIFLAAGILLVYLIIGFDWRFFVSHKGIIFGIYFFCLALLLATYFFAPSVKGARAWLVVGSFNIQASEFAKIALILLFAGFFSRKHIGVERISNLAVSFFYFALPAFLIMLQPDLGSVLILFSIWFGFLLISGISWRRLAFFFVIFFVVGILMWAFFLKNYQKERISGLIFPERDPLGINYSVIQSKIAIGSGGFFGKGFRQGTQVQLGFLPEAQTDFIFAALSEEFGLVGGGSVIAAFLFLIFRIIKTGLDANNNFGRFVCLGASLMFLAQFVLNIGSALGLTPVVGVTFPFLSYGGSSLLTNFILIGIIQSVVARR